MCIAKMISKLTNRLRPRPKLEKWEDVIAAEWEKGRIRRFDRWVSEQEYHALYDLLWRMREI